MERCLREVAQVRFWTFTLTNRYAATPAEHYGQLRRSWQTFLTYIRRSPIVPEEARGVQFIIVVEQHKSGAYHLHVLADRYIEWHIVQLLWERSCQRALGSREHVGFCWVKWVPTRTAVRYVVKYVTKASAELPPRKKRWTKTRGLPAMREVFPRKPGQWVIARVSPHSGELVLTGEATISHEGVDPTEFWAETLSGESFFRNFVARLTDRAPPS